VALEIRVRGEEEECPSHPKEAGAMQRVGSIIALHWSLERALDYSFQDRSGIAVPPASNALFE
jgi:hypothetical protein